MPLHQIKREPVTPAPVFWRGIASRSVEVHVTAGCGYEAEAFVVLPSFKRTNHVVHPNDQPAPPAADARPWSVCIKLDCRPGFGVELEDDPIEGETEKSRAFRIRCAISSAYDAAASS
jgi:hypothetical protein